MINKFSIINGSNYFYEYYKIISSKKHIKYFHGTARIYSCKSNGMPEENVTNSDSNFVENIVDHHALPDIILMETFNKW